MLIIPFSFYVGMSIVFVPVAALPLPFMSYGGSHLLMEFIALGILMSHRRSTRTFHRDDMQNEFVGV